MTMEQILIVDQSGQSKKITFSELTAMLNRGESFSVISNEGETPSISPQKTSDDDSGTFYSPTQQEKLKRLYLPPHHYQTTFPALIKKITGQRGFSRADKISQLIVSGRFLPHHNILKGQKPFSHVFGSIEDNLDSIFDRLKELAVNFQNNLSSTLDFSKIRPKMSLIKSTQGFSAGPVSFVRVYASTLEALRQNQAADQIPEQNFQLDIHHPDILEYLIFIKNFQKNTLNRNLRFLIGITPAFLEALERDGDFELLNPTDGQTVNLLSAKNTFDLIVSTIMENPRLELTRSGNSPNNRLEISAMINLAAYRHEELEQRLPTDLQLIEQYLQFQVQQESRKQQTSPLVAKINFTGWAELLIATGISYDSLTAIDLAEKIFLLARKSLASTTLTGTDLRSPLLGIFSGSRGLEALEQLASARTNLEGQEVLKLHPQLNAQLQQHGLVTANLTKNIFENNSLQDIYQIPPSLKALFRTGPEIDHQFHLEFQRKIEQTTGSNIEKKIYFGNPLDQEKIKNALLKHLIGSQSCLGFFQFGSQIQNEEEKTTSPGRNFLGTINRQRKHRHREIQPPLFQIKKTEEILPPPIST